MQIYKKISFITPTVYSLKSIFKSVNRFFYEASVFNFAYSHVDIYAKSYDYLPTNPRLKLNVIARESITNSLTNISTPDFNQGYSPDFWPDFNHSTKPKSPSKQPKLKVMMLGLRGFPNVQGGVETHAEHLCPLLVSMGCEVEVIARSPYQPKQVGQYWQGVKLSPIWAPKSKGLEALAHTFFGVLYAAIKRPDILHIHAIGPAIMTPLARLLGLRVVVTHHGPDYNRQKWGFVARHILLLGEYMGMRFSNSRIVISNVIKELVLQKHLMHTELIRNGVKMPDTYLSTINADKCLSKFDLTPGKYVLLVSRLVPEKRHLDLINAFDQANLDGWKLVLVGASDHPDVYVESLINRVANSANVVMTGYLTGEPLKTLYANAGLFVLPSSHEGLSISLLEALSYGLPVLASDIPANLELGLPNSQYFALGDVCELAQKLTANTFNPINHDLKSNLRHWVDYRYNWQGVAAQTVKEYQSALH